MNRRDFVQIFAAPDAQVPDAPPPIPRPPIPTVPTAGSPRQYPRGSCVLVEDARAWLCRDDSGFYAIDAICPHLGGDVRPDDSGGFLCACHHSRFGAQGERLAGAARRDLRYLYLELDAHGHLIISRDRLADARDRLMA